MSSLSIALALLFALLGCGALYLASPNQRWRAKPLPAWPTRLSASLLLLASLCAFTRTLGGVSAVYTFGSWVMLLLVALPYLGALRRGAAR